MNRTVFASIRRRGIAAVATVWLSAAGGSLQAQTTAPIPAEPSLHTPNPPAGGRFFCNTAALTPEDRARHQRLTLKLLASRTAVVEYSKGYEFQFRPSDVSIAELAEWVVAESKCCPFFDFHIDLEEAGSLACLRLTGADGIKPFIPTEFGLEDPK